MPNRYKTRITLPVDYYERLANFTKEHLEGFTKPPKAIMKMIDMLDVISVVIQSSETDEVKIKHIKKVMR